MTEHEKVAIISIQSNNKGILMGYRNSNIDYAAMREDAEEQAAFNRKVGYRGKSNPFQEYNDAMSDRQDLIDQAR